MACGSPASSAPSPTGRPPSGASDSAASPIGGDARCASSAFAPRFAVEAYLRGPGRALHARLRPQLLPVPFQRHGSLRPRRTRRQLRGRTARRAQRSGPGDRRRERHAVPDPGAGRDRAGVRTERRCPPASLACPRSRGTTPSWSTSRVSAANCAPSSTERPAPAAGGRAFMVQRVRRFTVRAGAVAFMANWLVIHTVVTTL